MRRAPRPRRPDRIDVRLLGTVEAVDEFARTLAEWCAAGGFALSESRSEPARQEGLVLFYARATKEAGPDA